MKKLKATFIAILLSLTAYAEELTLEQVQSLLESGNVAEATAAADSISKAKPKSGDACYLLGKCYEADQRLDEAIEAYTRAVELDAYNAYLTLAAIATERYDIAAAEQYITDYKARLTKNKRKQLPDESGAVEERMTKIRTMLDRVEKFQIIDSINVDKRNFFEAYQLTHESGSLNTIDLLPSGFPFSEPTSVYRTEDRREMIWSATDVSTGKSTLRTTNYLADGTWEEPVALGDHLGGDGNANYPFLMADGITLYFASDCSESLGGYDIFIARNNGTGFLQPQNIGMPYNSAADDYMLAIDEMTGVGWWATDRNKLGDKLTIYMFIPSELRINVDINDPSLADRAHITSIRSTWEKNADYSALLNKVAAIIPQKSAASQQFDFTLPDGKHLTRYEDFTNPQAREAMGRYVDLSNEIADLKEQLEALRVKYAKGDTTLEMEILYLERDLVNAQNDLARVKNDIIRAEIR